MRAKRFGEFIGEATAPAVVTALERLQAGNLEFISGLIKEYEKDVPYSSRVLIGSLDGLKRDLTNGLNLEARRMIDHAVAGRYPDSGEAARFASTVTAAFDRAANEKLSGVSGWAIKRAIRAKLDRGQLIKDLTRPSGAFRKYVTKIRGLVSRWGLETDGLDPKMATGIMHAAKRILAELYKQEVELTLKLADGIAKKIYD
jgi:hypothetical protein